MFEIIFNFSASFEGSRHRNVKLGTPTFLGGVVLSRVLTLDGGTVISVFVDRLSRVIPLFLLAEEEVAGGLVSTPVL